MIKNMIGRIRNAGTKKLVIASAFAVAMIAAAGLGFATKQYTQAASMPRECDSNAILRCGAHTPNEFINDVKSNNGGTQGDLKNIYADSRVGGLSTGDYDRFANTARMGKVFKNGDVYVNNQIVMTGAHSMGREKFNDNRKPISIGGKTYYYSAVQNSFAVNSIDAMVMFDANGAVETVILTACGNPVWGTKKTPKYSCDKLTKTPVAGKKDTYTFKTDATAVNNASIVRYDYNFGDGTTKSSTSNTIEHTFTKPGNYEVTVKVIVKLPGNQQKEVTAINCKTKVTVEAPPTPVYACDALIAKALDDKKRSFRVTVNYTAKNGATIKDADFILDGGNPSNVKPNAQGVIAKDYSFADSKTHTIVAKVNFNIAGKVTSVTCQTKVTPEKEPYCPTPGKEHLPPEHPDCAEKPVTPPTPPQELPKTGMGSFLGIFAGATAAGTVGHRVFMSRRQARRDNIQG